MYTFERRDDGHLGVHENGKAIAHVETTKIEDVEVPNPVTKKYEFQRKVTPLAADLWKIHPTGSKFSIADWEQFLEEVKKLEAVK